VIAADGELNAARALKEAAETISKSSTAMQLRYLQTLNIIANERGSTILFPLPIDILGPMVCLPSAWNVHVLSLLSLPSRHKEWVVVVLVAFRLSKWYRRQGKKVPSHLFEPINLVCACTCMELYHVVT
jgi:hypothetical protein